MRNKLLLLLACVVAQCSALAQTYHDGYLKQEMYDEHTRADIPAAGDPTDRNWTLFPTTFELGSFGDSYAQRISGFFTPNETTDYVFFLATDDDSDLFLSTNADPANKKLIAQEGSWSNSRSWNTSGGPASVTADRRSDTFSLSEWPTPNVIRLTAGVKYYIELVHHEGGGGDLVGVYVKKAADPDPADGDAPSTAGGTWSVLQVPLSVVTHPVNTNVVESTTASFTVEPSQTPGITYQWQVGGVNIPDATNITYSFTATAADNNKAYRVVINAINGQTVTSNPATLTVTTDTTAPTIVSAGSFHAKNGIQLIFSEPMSATGLTTAGNYAVSGGVTVSGVDVVSDRSVFLRTSALTSGTSYTVTASNLRDQASGAGNLLSPNTVTFTAAAGVAANLTAKPYVLYERWGANEGVTSIDTIEDAVLAETPPAVKSFLTAMEAPADGDNYGARMRTYFIPPQSGNYVFYGSSDDQGRFYLSTDSDPANKKLLAVEPQWNDNRDWVTLDRRDPVAPENRSDKYALTEWPSGHVIPLVGGQAYYAEVRFYEGGGGDNGAMTFKLASEADPVDQAPTRLTDTNIVTYLDLTTAPPILVRLNGSSTNYNKGARIEMSVEATGQAPLTYQWHRNKLPIPGATSATYVIPSADHTHVGDYSVALMNPAGTNTTFSTDNNIRLLMNGAFLIEAEDFNYEGGKHISSASQMPYLGNAYLGLTPTLDVDFFHDSNESGADGVRYQRGPADAEGYVETKGPGDAVDNAFNRNRGTFSVTNNYAVGWTDKFEWQNYTRTFPAGRYAIYMAAAHDGLPTVPVDENTFMEINMYMSRVANPTIPDGSAVGSEGGAQGLTKIGDFLSPPTGGWSSNDLIPLTDDTGAIVETQLSGTQTLRLTFNEADGDADYFLLYCLDCVNVTQPTLTVTRSGNNVTITSDNGGTVQATGSLSAPITWTDLGPAPQTVEATGTARFFRVQK
jgi:hypothetical protein